MTGQAPWNGGDEVAPNVDRELGAILQRLTNIEKRLDEGDSDIKALAKTTTELTIAVAGMTSKMADQQQQNRAYEGKIVEALERLVTGLGNQPSRPQPGMSPAAVAAVAVPSAGGGSVIGAAIWTKVASLLGLS